MVGGVFAATGVTLLVLRPKAQKPSVSFGLGPGALVAQGRSDARPRIARAPRRARPHRERDARGRGVQPRRGARQAPFTDATTCGEACDDADPCTDGDCTIDGACKGTPVPDGPVLTDPIGDCQLVSCVAGEPEVAADAADVPDDDGDPCTEELCAEGKPSHPTRADGAACVATTGLTGTCAAGACQVKCSADVDCDDKNPCDRRLRPHDAPLRDHAARRRRRARRRERVLRLHVHERDGDAAGVEAAGRAVQLRRRQGLRRRGSLRRVQRRRRLRAGLQDECSVAVCNANKTCGTAPAPAGTKLVNAPQKPGDCVTLYCDGMGGVTTEADDADLPDDNNVCTTETCMSGAVTTTPVALGTSCGAGMACNGKGVCKTATAQACAASTDCASGVCSDAVCCPPRARPRASRATSPARSGPARISRQRSMTPTRRPRASG